MIYPENFEHKIGFHLIREMLKGHCISAMGLEYAEQMEFNTHREVIERSLDQTMEFVELLRNGVPFLSATTMTCARNSNRFASQALVSVLRAFSPSSPPSMPWATS